MSERAANELDEIENLTRKPSEADKEGEDDKFDEDEEVLDEEESDAA